MHNSTEAIHHDRDHHTLVALTSPNPQPQCARPSSASPASQTSTLSASAMWSLRVSCARPSAARPGCLVGVNASSARPHARSANPHKAAHTPAAHPAAPKDATNWPAFLKKSHPGGVAPSASAVGNIPLYPTSAKPADFDNFWEAPAYYWQRPELSEREIEAVMVSLRCGMPCGSGSGEGRRGTSVGRIAWAGTAAWTVRSSRVILPM